MAINVKKLNRVRLHSVGGIEVLETLNSGDKKPAFRQNGYEVDEITKKSFALELDAANSEYVKTNFTETTVLVGDLDIEVIFRDLVYVGSGVQQIFNTTFAPTVNSNYLYIRVQDANNIRISIGATALSVAINLSATNTVRLIGKDLYVNGAFIQTLNTASPAITFYEWTLLGASRPSGINPIKEFLDGSILSLRLQGETFKLTEGLGNQVFGSNGTIGTIHTSNAQGIERTNYGQWLKGDDTNGWNPYT